MYQLSITTVIAADRDRTFDALSDHTRFLRGPGLDCQLTHQGAGEPNGLGAHRRVDAGRFVFDEDIVAFERPTSYEYRITELGGSLGRLLPFEHQLGRLALSELQGQTRVNWVTRYRIPIPILGWVVERLIGFTLKGAFTRLLDQADSDLQSNDT